MFGQYDFEDIVLSGGDVWTGSIYDPGMIPADWTSEWVSQWQPSGGGLPVTSILQTVLGAGTSIAAALLGKKTTTTPTTAIPTTDAASSTTLSSFLSSPILLLGGVGLGAYFLLRKKRGKK